MIQKNKNLIGKICQHGTEANPMVADNFVLGQRKTAKAYGKSDQTKFNLSTDKVAEGQCITDFVFSLIEPTWALWAVASR